MICPEEGGAWIDGDNLSRSQPAAPSALPGREPLISPTSKAGCLSWTDRLPQGTSGRGRRKRGLEGDWGLLMSAESGGFLKGAEV